ncbi:MAG TPA: LytR C-terminal domain-containing protein [Fibrobacteria bacterium]|nr:LytR C-terminal domain-containing protein [Fibrobacteria bacterium]
MKRPTPAGRTRPHPLFRVATRLLVTGACSLTMLSACGTSPEPVAFKANSGQIQVLNGNGRAGLADLFRTHLIEQGFDVIESGNARSWSYEHTLVLARTESDTIAHDLARALGTRRVVHLRHPASLVEATVIIGKDYKELMRTWPQRPQNQP